MAGIKLACERGELSYGWSVVVCYERRKARGVEGPTFVVLRQTEREKPAIHCSLSDAAGVVCKAKRSSCLKDKVCLLKTTRKKKKIALGNNVLTGFI